MNDQEPIDSPRPLAQTRAASPLAHGLLRILDATATGTLAAVRSLLAHTDHTPVPAVAHRTTKGTEES